MTLPNEEFLESFMTALSGVRPDDWLAASRVTLSTEQLARREAANQRAERYAKKLGTGRESVLGRIFSPAWKRAAGFKSHSLATPEDVDKCEEIALYAAVAVVMWDQLSEADFLALYGPFDQLIPRGEIGIPL